MTKKLGKKPARGDVRLLSFAKFAQLDKVPAVYDPWKRRAPFPARTFGNRDYGDCTRASQAQHMLRLERVETRQTPQITDEEVIRVYLNMTERLYGGGDTGAYEIDALSEWRNPETTFRNTQGRALTIDAFTAINHRDVEQVKAALCLSGKFGIKFCLNLPSAFAAIDPPAVWDIPADQPLTDGWEPGSWGGHSLYGDSYDRTGPRMAHTWYEEGIYQQAITWRAFATYCDEAYWVLDSLDGWRKRTPAKFAKAVDLEGIIKAVNKVSSHKIAV